MENMEFDGTTLSGNLKYVTGYTEFNGSDPEEQEGNYLVLDFADSFMDGKVTSIEISHTGGNQKKVTLASDDSYLVLRVVDPQDVITATPTGASGELQSRTIHLAVTLEEKTDNENSLNTMSFENETADDTVYTQEMLESMTVNQIKEVAAERGYTITKVIKADVINEFLSQQA